MSPRNGRIFFVINPVAGRGNGVREAEKCRTALANHGFPTDGIVTEAPRHACEVARTAADDCTAIIAVGGDGTVNEVANGVIESGASQTALGILPVGTGNDVAGALGIRRRADLETCLIAGQMELVDVVEVHFQSFRGVQKRIALLYAAMGFPADVVRRTTPLIKRWAGPQHCYTVGVLLALTRLISFKTELATDTEHYSGPCVMAWAGNFERICSGTIALSPGADPSDGIMEVGIFHCPGRLSFVKTFCKTFKGAHIYDRNVRYFQAREATIKVGEECHIVVDGELAGLTPADVMVRAQALRVLSGRVNRPGS
jgi:YegS/Rv2252/BmrU family lipid kinase